jgi:hypothetical protein
MSSCAAFVRGVRSVTSARAKALVRLCFCVRCSQTHSRDTTSDGHRRCIVEHTIHVLFLPGLHTAAGPSPKPAASSSSLDYASSVRDRQDEPALVVPGTRLALPSPLHVRLPVTTRLDFNDAGRITHHR